VIVARVSELEDGLGCVLGSGFESVLGSPSKVEVVCALVVVVEGDMKQRSLTRWPVMVMIWSICSRQTCL